MLEFKFRKREYELRFNVFPIIQIEGKSGSGKSLLCSDLKAHIAASNRDDVHVTNILETKELTLEEAVQWKEKYKYIVIDNADLLITEQLQELISDSVDERKNYWVLMGRNNFWCVDMKCMGELRERREGERTLFDVVYE
jgi:ABC-type lipoprotein export system ATPase subunit